MSSPKPARHDLPFSRPTLTLKARGCSSRLQRELDTASQNTSIPRGLRLRAGYCAVSDFATANLDVKELVHRAESALAKVPPGERGPGVLSYDELSVS